MPDPEALLQALDPEQQAVATALHGPVCVLAGAGTGKTRALTYRIALGVATGAYDPRRVLAVTFTTRAAGEMRGRLRGLGVPDVQARTFHSAALRQARYFWPHVVGRQLPQLIDRKIPLVTDAARRCRVATDIALLRDLASEIEWAKVSNVRPGDYTAAATRAGRQVAEVPVEAVAQVYAAYEDVKTDRDLLDMEDVLLAAVGLLSSHPGVADQVRAQYHHFLVDEYQDVSPLQQRLLELWLGDRTSVCVVGDPAQTIYSFAGARADYLLQFPRRFEGAEVLRLVRNYRCTPQVIAVANDLLRSGGDAAAQMSSKLQSQQGDGPPPQLRDYSDDVVEAEAVATEIRQLIDEGTPPREIAVLFRTNSQSEAFEQALSEQKIPYVLRGGERFFDRPEIRRAAMLLRGAARAGEQSDDPVADVRVTISQLGWSAAGPAGSGAARERWESLAALLALAEDLKSARPEAQLADVVAELDARAAAQHAPVAEGVTLASLHAAKGLEWDAVFIVGCNDGMIPIAYAETSAEIAEERRLLYVGVTRARRVLRLSWSLSRTPGGRAGRQPSRFLAALRSSVQSPSAGSGSGGNRRNGRGARGDRGGARSPKTTPRCRICGKPVDSPAERKLLRCADCPGNVDERLFAALREWRLAESRDQSVPAFVVFTDATLIAIAESRPVTLEELSKIPGVGKVKLERYGSTVLALCRDDHADADAAAADESGQDLRDTTVLQLRDVREGK